MGHTVRRVGSSFMSRPCRSSLVLHGLLRVTSLCGFFFAIMPSLFFTYSSEGASATNSQTQCDKTQKQLRDKHNFEKRLRDTRLRETTLRSTLLTCASVSVRRGVTITEPGFSELNAKYLRPTTNKGVGPVHTSGLPRPSSEPYCRVSGVGARLRSTLLYFKRR